MITVSMICVLSIFWIVDCEGLVPPNRALPYNRPSSLSKHSNLYSTHGGYYNNGNGHNEGDYHYMLEKAREFAFSASNSIIFDTSSDEAAKSYLQSIVTLQKDCLLGTVSGDDLCNIDDDIAELVFKLQEIIGEMGG
jgi:hypothetical protein